jgi:hypothetical protein
MIMSIKDAVDDNKEEKTIKVCKTSSPVAIPRFTPARTKGEC